MACWSHVFSSVECGVSRRNVATLEGVGAGIEATRTQFGSRDVHDL